MIAIVDYSVGNLRSVAKGFEHAGVSDVIVTSDPAVIEQAHGLVLPGVGAFRDARNSLTNAGFEEVLRESVAKGTPLLGICLGMQLLFDVSFENGEYAGLGLVPGEVRKFDDLGALKIPHMGWNTVEYAHESQLFKGIPDSSAFYFVHSYYCAPNSSLDIIGETTYGRPFTCAVQHQNVFGVQFHPEKSSRAGLHLLANFAGIVDEMRM